MNESFRLDPLPNPAMAVMAVFQLLTKKITEGEIEDVRHCLPEEIRNIWPEPYKEPERSATYSFQSRTHRAISELGRAFEMGGLINSFRSASPQRFNMALRTESRSLEHGGEVFAGRLTG